MTMARMDVIGSDRARSRERFDDDDELPTTVFRRNPHFDKSVVRAAPRDERWSSPSSGGAFADEVSRSIIERIVRELPPLAPARSAEALEPVTAPRATNVFLTKPRDTDPPPPWAALPAPVTRPGTLVRKRRSRVPFFAFAVAAAIGVGLWRDPAARASVSSDLAHAASRVAAVVGAI